MNHAEYDAAYEILTTLLPMQDELNQKTQDTLDADKPWRSVNRPWARYLYMEAAELAEALGGCHWKTAPDISVIQIQLELVDLLHFSLSYHMQCDDNLEKVLARDVGDLTGLTALQLCDVLVCVNSMGQSGLAVILALAKKLGLTMLALGRLFTAKNALNEHRQAGGYSKGEYKRINGGFDDNQTLERVLATDGLPPDLREFRTEILSRLADKAPSNL